MKKQNEYADQIDLFTSTTTKQERQIEGLRQRIEKMEINANKNNVLIYGIEEEDEEDCKQSVTNFIKVKMEATEEVTILDAYRIGKGMNRPVLVQLSSIADKNYLFQHAKNLKGKKNNHNYSYFIQNDLPEDSQECDRWQRQLFVKNKRSVANKLMMSFKNKHLHISNRPYKKAAPTPSQADLLLMTQEDRQKVQNAKVVRSKQTTEKNNTFSGYAIKTFDIREVHAVYKHLKLKHADSTHVTLAYHAIGDRPVKSDYSDDGEIGAGRKIVDWLIQYKQEGVAVYIVRYHSGQNLGPCHFEIIIDTVSELCESLKAPENFVTSTVRPRTERLHVRVSSRWALGRIIRGRGRGTKRGAPGLNEHQSHRDPMYNILLLNALRMTGPHNHKTAPIPGHKRMSGALLHPTT